MVTSLGFQDVFVVCHAIGAQPAYSYASAYPDILQKLAVMDYIYPTLQPATDMEEYVNNYAAPGDMRRFSELSLQEVGFNTEILHERLSRLYRLAMERCAD